MTPAPSPADLFRGVIPVLITPFRHDETLDLEALGKIVEFMVRAGVNALTILGVLGEAERLTDDERARVITTTVAASAGRLPVIVGVGHAGTEPARQQARTVATLGAQGIMAVPPRDLAGNEQGILDFYSRLAEATALPLCIQDHPASSGVSLPVSLLLRLIEEVPTAAGVKVEAMPSAPKIAALVRRMGRRAALLAGLGAVAGYCELQSGADGLMTGLAFPEILVALFQAMRAGDEGRAFQVYRRYLPLIVFENHHGLTVRKEIRRRGLIDCGRLRHPGASIDEGTCQQLQGLLQRMFPAADLSRQLAIVDDGTY